LSTAKIENIGMRSLCPDVLKNVSASNPPPIKESKKL